jgi:O-antigen ligase
MAIYFMFVVYLYLLKDYNKTKNYIYLIYGLQIIYAFHRLYTDRLNFLSLEHELFDSNAGFILICLLPMSLIIPLRRLRIYLCAIIVLGCIYSGQRSAALAATLCFPFCIAYLKGCIKRMDILIFLLAFVFVAIPILQDAITNIEMRNSLDIQNDNFGSGRSEFWADVWNAFWNGNIFQILFGHGANSVPELLVVKYGTPIWSHNGWLDALYMYGFVGFVIYGCIVLRLYRYNRKISHTLKNYKNIFLIIFLLFMVKSTTSHGNWDISVMPLVIAIAIVMVDYKQCSLSLQ